MKYELLEIEKIYHIEPDSKGRFYIKVVASDKNHYQIKFDSDMLCSNINEFISNYIAVCMEAPVLQGAFLQFSDYQLNTLFEHLSKNLPRCKPNMNLIKDKVMFGIKWQRKAAYIQTEDELKILLKLSKNPKSFYSLYSYDQYLKNLDRHLGNHIFNKDDKGHIENYYLIDGDRIFQAKKIKDILALKDDFSCLSLPSLGKNDWHIFLHEFVTDETFNHVLMYATNIDNIKDDDITYMINLINLVYTTSKIECDIIEQFLNHRKKLIFLKTMENSKCFPNITQRRLS